MTAAATKPDLRPIVDLRLALLANGYIPVPVNGKRPRIKGWTTFRPSAEQLEGQARKYADHKSTGIICENVAAVDIDALDEATAEQLIIRLMQVPGADRAPCRVGKAPKALFLFRTGVPLSKRMTPEYSVRGKKCQIEVLGEVQQFVAFGLHADTGREYTWSNGDPLSVPVADLPEITETQIDAYIADAATILAAAGKPVKETKALPRAKSATGGTFWTRCNAAALAAPERWVRSLFPSARKETGTGAWRVSSSDLGRGLEEDISIHADGVRDFGEEKPVTPIQLVMDYGGAPTTRDAAHWLCEQIGINPHDIGWENRQPVAVRFGALLTPPEPANDDAEDWRKEEEELFRSDATLSDLTRPGGYLEELIDWIVSSAEHPSRELALSAVIPFVGSLIGRRFAGYRDARSNVYAIALAPSGYGKDHARQQIKRLIAAENLHPFSGRQADVCLGAPRGPSGQTEHQLHDRRDRRPAARNAGSPC